MAQAGRVRKLIDFIEQERVRQNLSARELAERSGLGIATISRILGRTAAPSLSSLESLANALGYTLEAFLMLAIGSPSGFQEVELLQLYRQLSPRDREIILALARSLREHQAEDAPATR